jgi:SAM-dependent methyltransferase
MTAHEGPRREPSRSDAIRVLGVSLLDEQRPTVTNLKRLARDLRMGLGWHYLLDLCWILDTLNGNAATTVVDAGAGTGIIQWYLAERHRTVISVDRSSRSQLSMRYRSRYQVRGLRTRDLEPVPTAIWRELGADGWSLRAPARQVWNLGELVRRLIRRPAAVYIYNQDLKSLTDIPDDSVDAVVAVSSLEHNPPDDLAIVVGELMRILRPGGPLIATLGASKDEDWFHEPSKGWCYTDATLRGIFGIDRSIASNYDEYDTLFEQLRDCAELRDGLAVFYFRSGANGMPWGVWDPRYQPVGVCKVKPVTRTESQ